MQTFFIVFHIIVSLILVAVILLQRSSTDELQGIAGGGSSALDGVMTGSSSANFMTKLTSILAFIFMFNCLVLVNLSSRNSGTSIVDKIDSVEQVAKGLPIAE
jgi:preprotein translocase subunit SecG